MKERRAGDNFGVKRERISLSRPYFTAKTPKKPGQEGQNRLVFKT
jgi:hypothetical protein